MENRMEKDEAYPGYFFDKIYDITVDDLREMGVKAVAVDLDNTTVVDSSFRMLHGVRKWMNEIRAAGYPFVIVTNTYPIRAWFFSKVMGNIPFFAFAKKPAPDKLLRAAAHLNVQVSEIALIGDQLFADVTAANRCGAVSVKVEPYSKEILFAKKFRRIRRREKEYLDKRKHYGNQDA